MLKALAGAALAGSIACDALEAQTPNLTAAQRAALDAGGRVVLQRQHRESPWPAVTVYLFVDATPEEAAAVFTDYSTHRTFIPSVEQSRISRVIDPATVEVDYVVDVPIVSDERYTVRNRLTADSGQYRVDWILIRASSTKATVGHARFIPYTNARTGKSGTLMEYYDFVTPGSRMASIGFIRNRAIRTMEETARAIARHIEAERHKSEAMRPRLAALRGALKKPTSELDQQERIGRRKE